MVEACSLSVVVPLFNEVEGVQAFARELRSVLDGLETDYEVVFVDDGSTDGTSQVIADLAWGEVRLVSLTRNVGHQAAIDAGLSLAQGEYVLTMDGDGQHPASVIPQMLKAVSEEQVDIVYTVQLNRAGDGFGKRVSALTYYRLVRWLTGVPIRDSQADFRLMHRRVLQAVADVPGDRVLRLLLPSIGFASTTIAYDVRPRIAGQGRFGLRRQLAMTGQSILGYSSKPLRVVATAGFALSLLAVVWFGVVLATYLSQQTIVGWTSVMTAVLLVGGLTLLSLSVIGAYIARIHDMMKRHPRYAIARVEPDDPSDPSPVT